MRGDADPRALVLAPTRELAIQIDKDARAIGRAVGTRSFARALAGAVHALGGAQLQKVTEREKVLTNDPGEKAVRQIFADRAKAADDKIKGLPGSYQAEKDALSKKVEDLKAAFALDGGTAMLDVIRGLGPAPATPSASSSARAADWA